MKILFIASECAPIAKVGGLADVAGSLPKEVKKTGADISVIIPFYGAARVKKEALKLVKGKLGVNFSGQKVFFNLWQMTLPESNVPLFLIENDNYFAGEIYLTEDASSEGSEAEATRFMFFSATVIEVAKLLNFDLLHCQDWHTSIIPHLIKRQNLPIKTLLTIHNLGYQGIYSSGVINKLLATNFSGDVNCLREGILYADFVNTVSGNYAKEILTPDFGFGLDDVLRKRKNDLVGILNGVDENVFNPSADGFLKKTYSKNSLRDKTENKIYLQEKYLQKNDSLPLIGMVSRIAQQKGFDLIQMIFDRLIKENIQFILLGKGIEKYEDFFRQKTKDYPDKFFAEIGFNEKLAHQIYAGSDIFLMPSYFEPCGLGQMIAMRYGTVPIVRAIGGLKDTVKNVKYKIQNTKLMAEGTGFLFKKYDGCELLKTINKALEFYKNKKIWTQIQKNGMSHNFSWQKSAKKYLQLYKKLIETK